MNITKLDIITKEAKICCELLDIFMPKIDLFDPTGILDATDGYMVWPEYLLCISKNETHVPLQELISHELYHGWQLLQSIDDKDMRNSILECAELCSICIKNGEYEAYLSYYNHPIEVAAREFSADYVKYRENRLLAKVINEKWSLR